MLIHLVGILCLASVSDGDVPSRLFAISHLKGIINELQDDLTDFRKNMTVELNKLETGGGDFQGDRTSCSKQISQAYNETVKLLNMLVKGEYNGLKTAEASLEKMSLNELSQLWGALVAGGKAQVKVRNELDHYRKTAKARIIEAIKGCEVPVNPEKSIS